MKNAKRCLFLTLALIMPCLSVSTHNVLADDRAASNNQLDIWGTYSMEKVLKDPNYNHNNTRLEAELDVFAANGETESGQIIVTAGDAGVKKFTVKAADLTNDKGDVYEAENVEIFNQFYARVDMKSHNQTLNADYFPAHDPNGSPYSGYTPDALIPQEYSIAAKENYIDKNANQGITFDFYVPKGTPAGEYTGSFTLTADGKNYSIPVTLTVWGFDISATHGMNLWDIVDGQEAIGEMTADYESLYDTYYEALMKYKLNAYHFFAHTTDDELDWVADLQRYSKNPAFGGVFLPDMGGERSRIYRYFAEIAKACIEDEVNYFSKIRFYHQKQDEPHDKPGMLDETVTVVNSTKKIISDIARELDENMLNDADGKAVEGFKSLSADLQAQILESIEYMPQCVTTYYYATDALHGIVSAFTPNIKRIETDWDERMYVYNAEVTNGEQWFYTSLFPEYPRPNYRVDDFSLAGRVQGWMKKDWDVFGYLNWACNIYGAVKGNSFISDVRVVDPYENPLRFNTDNRNFSNGDGYMFYPMAKYHADSPIPSVRLLTARDGQEDYDTLWTLEEAYGKLAAKYDMNSETVISNLDSALGMYYEMLYNGLVYNTSSANFERVRRSIGGLTEAATDASKTMITQTLSNGGANAMLRIYSQADEVWVNGRKLDKINGYYGYSAALENGRNSVTIEYTVGDTTKSFEYIVANKTYSYTFANDVAVQAPAKGNSTIALTNGVFDFKVASYGTKVAELMGTKLDFKIPFDFDFTQVHNLSFTIKNTTTEFLEVEVYVKGQKGLVLLDKIAVFEYETYKYNLNHVYAKIANAGAGVDSLIFRFPNYTMDNSGKVVAMPDRELQMYDFAYSLK